jgi:CRISPR-associated DxTHG motif protein
MARRLISFLGAGEDYDELPHLHPDTNDIVCETHMVQEAIAQAFPEIDEVSVLVTPQAKEQNWSRLQQALESVDLRTVDPLKIPFGFSEDDQWAVFEQLRAASEGQDEVLLDITHSFRSIPLVAVAAALYLKEMEDTDVQVLYGALQNEEVQLVRLTPFLRLVEMAFAARSFLRHGDLRPLAENLEALGEIEQGDTLESTGDWVGRMARALNLLRLPEIKRYSTQTRQELTQIVGVPAPAADILNRIRDSFDGFSGGDLGHSLQQLRYYRQRHQWVEALLCSRELVLTLVCHRFDLDPTQWDNRKPIRDRLNKEGKRVTVKGTEVTLTDNLIEWFGTMGSLRNQVAHNAVTEDIPHHKTAEEFEETVEQEVDEFIGYVEDYISGAEIQLR